MSNWNPGKIRYECALLEKTNTLDSLCCNLSKLLSDQKLEGQGPLGYEPGQIQFDYLNTGENIPRLTVLDFYPSLTEINALKNEKVISYIEDGKKNERQLEDLQSSLHTGTALLSNLMVMARDNAALHAILESITLDLQLLRHWVSS